MKIPERKFTNNSGERLPALEIVVTDEASCREAANLRDELCMPVTCVSASINDPVDFTRGDLLEAFAERIFEPRQPSICNYSAEAAKGRGTETVFMIDAVREHARYRDFFESGLAPQLCVSGLTTSAGENAVCVRALRAADGREAAFVVNKTDKRLVYEFDYGGNHVKSTIEPLWWNVHSARQVTVDYSKPCGEILPLNGTGGGPTLAGRGGSPADRKASFRALNVGSVRLHDIPHAVSNQKLVDVPHIFPLWIPKADPADSENYYFAATDDYLKMLKECGVKRITYRLGTSIEDLAAQARSYFTDPGDFDRYAEVCAGIVRHYVRGWGWGFDAGVTHWEVWNEPDLGGHGNWALSFDDYCRFYATVAKRLKREFPEIKVGGPASCGASKRVLLHFAEKCAEAGAPIDFLSFHSYPFDWITSVRILPDLKEGLAKLGYGNVELHLDEWHYRPCSWGELQTKEGWTRWAEETEDGLNGADAGAFTALAITRWQDSGLTMANYYMTTCFEPVWGLYNSLGDPRPPWWALKFIGALSEGCRVADSSVGDISVLAGISKDGVRRMVVSDFKGGTDAPVEIEVRGVPSDMTAHIETIDAAHPFSPVVRDVPLPSDGRIVLGGGSSSVSLVELNPDFGSTERNIL